MPTAGGDPRVDDLGLEVVGVDEEGSPSIRSVGAPGRGGSTQSRRLSTPPVLSRRAETCTSCGSVGNSVSRICRRGWTISWVTRASWLRARLRSSSPSLVLCGRMEEERHVKVLPRRALLRRARARGTGSPLARLPGGGPGCTIGIAGHSGGLWLPPAPAVASLATGSGLTRLGLLVLHRHAVGLRVLSGPQAARAARGPAAAPAAVLPCGSAACGPLPWG